MSLLGKVEAFFTGALHGLGDLAKKVFGGIRAVWTFITHITDILDGAWDWMVNGVTWLTSQVTDWAATVYNTLWHTLTNVIPGAVAWVFNQAIRWAGRAVHNAEQFLRGLVKNVATWARRELHTLSRTAKKWVSDVIHWVTGPIRWVLTVGRHVANLVLHPQALAEWIVGALVVPLIKWVLKAGAPVIAWALKLFVRDTSEFAHLIEDVLSRII